MKIRVTTGPERRQEEFIVNDAPNQRDAKLIAMREMTGCMVPPEGTTAIIIDLYARS